MGQTAPFLTEEAPKSRNVFHDLKLSDGLQVVVGGLATYPPHDLTEELNNVLCHFYRVSSPPQGKSC